MATKMQHQRIQRKQDLNLHPASPTIHQTWLHVYIYIYLYTYILSFHIPATCGKSHGKLDVHWHLTVMMYVTGVSDQELRFLKGHHQIRASPVDITVLGGVPYRVPVFGEWFRHMKSNKCSSFQMQNLCRVIQSDSLDSNSFQNFRRWKGLQREIQWKLQRSIKCNGDIGAICCNMLQLCVYIGM